jgi:hypothetical protein
MHTNLILQHTGKDRTIIFMIPPISTFLFFVFFSNKKNHPLFSKNTQQTDKPHSVFPFPHGAGDAFFGAGVHKKSQHFNHNVAIFMFGFKGLRLKRGF